MCRSSFTAVVWVVALGCCPSLAFAYPGGAAVSTGNNPVASYGGEVLGVPSSSASVPSVTVLTASADQDFVVTDVNLMPRYTSLGCRVLVGVELALTGGSDTLAHYHLTWEQSVTSNNVSAPGYVDSHLISGLRVPAGASLEMTIKPHSVYGCGDWGVTYTLSGYHATP